MIVCFDILLLDDDVCLREPHRKRRLLLQDVFQLIPGRAAIAEQEVLDFSRSDSRGRLEIMFASAISKRWEGCVLKASEEPYFPMYSTGVEKTFGRWIKLKKDYIPGLGDTVDFALIGGFYDAHDAAAPSNKVRWTHLLVGCLLNKENSEFSKTVPRFKVVDVVNHHCMHRDILQYFNQVGEFYACDPEEFEGFDVEYGHSSLPRASSLFKKPFVVEMMGSGFEKPSNARYFTLRFPRILKVHTDRTFQDAVSHRELQLLAENARSISEDDLSQEREEWCKRLKVGNGLNQYIAQRSHSPSSRSSSVKSDADSQATELSDTSHDKDVPDSRQDREHSQKALLNTAHGSMHSSNDVPAVYVDEIAFPEEPRSSKSDGVLAENQNLSSRQAPSQTGANTLVQPPIKHGKRPPGNMWMKARPPLLSDSQTPSVVSIHPEQIEEPDPIAPSSNENNNPRSPLMTVPVYMSGVASNLPPKQESPGLHKFFQAVGSIEARSSLQQSNPEAVSNSIAFGIVLVNPRETSLGQEIYQTAQALQGFRARECYPPLGRIFFLDSHIVKQLVQPKDLRFCLRATWVDLGKKYYYACLRWDSGPDSSSKETPQLETHYKRCRPELTPPVSVSFAQTEILAMGEYESINPLLCFDD
ncbi:Nucleic acid-binding OB-fold [Penicillium atrosanguineum]|nr:Nucleic acid-binding OB-fold [Penicillium atrosanguineum]